MVLVWGIPCGSYDASWATRDLSRTTFNFKVLSGLVGLNLNRLVAVSMV